MNIRPRPWLEGLKSYRPGGKADNPDGSMASNESPLGASPKVLAAIAAAAVSVHRYPDMFADELRRLIAESHGVNPTEVVVGNGSAELIFRLASAFLTDGGCAVTADPPYRVNELAPQIVNARLIQVPLRDWRHDLDAMANIESDIAFIVNPHNPAGTTVSRVDIERFVMRSCAKLVVVDEAYIQFADDPAGLTCLPLIRSGRVAVLRTFSKVYGLAGLRVGYLVADTSIVEILHAISAPFSVGTLAQIGAIAALRDTAYSENVRAYVRRTRRELVAVFEEAGYRVVPSEANFVLVICPDEARLVERLAQFGVSVRPGGTLGAPGTVRVSVPSIAGIRLLRDALGATARPQDS